MYLYLSIHFFTQNASLKLMWYCWTKLKQKFSIWGEFDHQKDSERFMLVIGLCNRSVHIMYARCCRTFLGVNFVVAFFSFIFVNINFRPTLGSPSFICPSFRFVTHIALSWLSFNNNNTYIAPISIFIYIYVSAIFISFILIKCLLSQSVCKTWQRSSASEQRIFPWSLSEVQINIPYHENRLQVLPLYSYKL